MYNSPLYMKNDDHHGYSCYRK